MITAFIHLKGDMIENVVKIRKKDVVSSKKSQKKKPLKPFKPLKPLKPLFYKKNEC